MDPVLDSEQYFVRLGPIDYQQDIPAERIASDLLHRSQLASEIGLSVSHNLRTAHERDCRRFKARRAGLYVPRIHHFKSGDFVFVISQGQTPGGTLGIKARNEVLSVVEVRDSGVLLLQNQAGRTIEKHHEHCVPCMLPNLLGDTYAGLVKPQADLACQVCRDHHHWESMLLCDNCDSGWHIYCLDPPLEEVPEGQWLCPDCVGCGVTLESLVEKQARLVTDPQSRPNLELPSRSRVARARQYHNLWHGKAVSHTTRGRTRYGRMAFQGILYAKWFRVDWSDGTSTEHNAGILRHLCEVDEAFLPVALPPIAEALLLWTRMVSPLKQVIIAEPEQVEHIISTLMGGPAMPAEDALDAFQQLSISYMQPQAGEDAQPGDLWWDALRHVLPVRRLGTCFLPLAGAGVPQQLLKWQVPCFVNHPCATSLAAYHLDPFQHATYARAVAANVADSCIVWPHAALLDILLPLAFSQCKHVVVALVPNGWTMARLPYRAVWLHDEVWRPQLGLLVRVVNERGTAAQHSWFLLFSHAGARERLVGDRIPSSCSECVWDARYPQQLQFVNSWHSQFVRRSHARQGMLA
jgi:hypothetical protein